MHNHSVSQIAFTSGVYRFGPLPSAIDVKLIATNEHWASIEVPVSFRGQWDGQNICISTHLMYENTPLFWAKQERTGRIHLCMSHHSGHASSEGR